MVPQRSELGLRSGRECILAPSVARTLRPLRHLRQQRSCDGCKSKTDHRSSRLAFGHSARRVSGLLRTKTHCSYSV